MNKFDVMKYKAVIFDLDGTLADSMYLWKRLLPDFMEKHDCRASDELLNKVNYMPMTCSSVLVEKEFPQLNMTAEEILSEWMEMIYEEYSRNVSLKPGAKEFIIKLKENGIKVGIATACAKNLTEACLENNGILDMIDVITYAEDVGFGKDNPQIYIKCLESLGCRAEDTILFEDIAVPIITAKKIGLLAIAVEDGEADEKEEVLENAITCIKDFCDIV